MDRRLFMLAICLAVAAMPLQVDLAYADDDNSGSGSDDDSGDDDSGDDDDSHDDDGGDDDGSDDGGTGGSTGGTGNTGGTGSRTPDHDRAQAAVADDEALPLKKLLALFHGAYDGEIVDITLIRRRSALVYRVKYVDPKGRVRRAEFDARSGSVLD